MSKFVSINSSKGVMKIFIDINDKKIQSDNKSQPNYYLLYFKDIEIKDEFKEYNFKIVNNINIKLSIKVKNKFNSEKVENLFQKFQPVQNKKEDNTNPKSVIGTGVNMKERLAMFANNKKENNDAKSTTNNTTNNNAPKKLKMPANFIGNNPTPEPQSNNSQKTNKNIKDNINDVKKQKIEENINKEEIKHENYENKEKEEINNNQGNNKKIKKKKTNIKIKEKKKKDNIKELKKKKKTKEKKDEKDEKEKQEKLFENIYESIAEVEEEEKVDNININVEIKKNSINKTNQNDKNKAGNLAKRPSYLGNFKNPIMIDKNDNDKKRTSQYSEAPQSKLEVQKSMSILERSKMINSLFSKNNIRYSNNTSNNNNNNNNNNNTNYKSIDFDKRNSSASSNNLNFKSKKKLEENYGLTPTSSSQSIEKDDLNDDMSYHTSSTEYSSCKSISSAPEIMLDSINFEKFLEQQKQKTEKGDTIRDSFCVGFFLASFPYKNGQVIENSNNNNYPALCHHKNCSKLNAMKPEILFKYPLEDTKDLELNNLAATICFPIGIKVCYCQTGPFNCDKDYITNITNQKGDKYYMMTYHFYVKMMNDEYSKKYEMNPLKHNLMKFGDAYLTYREEEFTDEIIEKIQKNLEYCQDLGFREFVYVPYCLCLISKYPYFSEMENCLQSIFIMLSKTEQIDNCSINDEIMYLIHSIPIPDKSSLVKFYVPYCNRALFLRNTFVNGLYVMNKDYAKLTTVFSISNIIIIFRLLLSEKKILFIDNDYSVLSKVTDAFISLLYPITWIHTYIPIMSEQMLKYLESFLPFLNGVHSSMMTLITNIFNEGEIDESEEVFLVYIKENDIQIGSSLKNKKIKMSKYIQNNVLALPPSVEKELKKKLVDVKDKYESFQKNIKKRNILDLNQLDYKFREAFIDVFVYLFHDYQKYIGLLDDDLVIFNKNLFIQEAKKEDKNFLISFLDSQLFEQFTQNILNSDMAFFNKKISSYGKKIKDKDKDLSSISSNIFNYDRNYVVKPDFLKLEDDDNNLYFEKCLTEKFKVEYKTDEKGIIIPSERIITNLNFISNDKYNNANCHIYLLPEKKEITQINKQEREEQENYRNELLKKINERRVISGPLADRARKQTVVGGAKREGNLTDKKREILKDEIKEWVIKIFKSEVEDYKSHPKIKTDVLSLINNRFGIKYFVELISRNKQGQGITMLQISSYKLLGLIIYNALLFLLNYEESDEVIEECVLLFKSAKSYSANYAGRNKTLMENTNFKDNLKKYVKINQKNFWMKWYNIDLKEKQDKKKEENEEIDIDEEDDLKQKTLFSVCLNMIDLEIPKVTIKNICDEINDKIFGKTSELGKQVQDIYIKYITSAKYVSKI